jgi:hypothetical protein
LKRSCQEKRTDIGEELSGNKTGDWRDEQSGDKLVRSCQEIRPEIGEEHSRDKIGDWRGAFRR